MTQTDWHRLIDTSFGDGPAEGGTPQDALRDGRRALRRRRVRIGGVAGGVVLVTALLVSAVPSLPNDSSTPEQVRDDSGTSTLPDAPPVAGPAPSTKQPTVAREVYRTAVGPLYLDRETGDLDLPDGWRELDRILDPFGPGSIALEITDGDDAYYLIATKDGSAGTIYIARPGNGSTLEEFVASSERDAT